MKNTNSLWNFFASVKLAIFTLCFIASSSIVGTIIPQGKQYAFYVTEYGPKMAQFFNVLDITDMYNSWWFVGLLGLLSANLIICSIDRFPTVLKIIRRDNLAIKPEMLKKMRERASWDVSGVELNKLDFPALLKSNGWKPKSKKVTDGELFFVEKGAWSRTGVYIVHTSIIVIFIGAIIGHFLGFKGSVMIPETKSTKKIYSFENSQPIELGFEVRCDYFAVKYYDNGMAKEYMSKLTVLENGKEILQKNIEVNSPLTYKGITFYQSSYEGYQDFVLTIKDNADLTAKTFVVPFQKQEVWQEKNIRFGIINAEAIGQRVVQAKLWIKAGETPATIQWLKDDKELMLEGGSNNYTVHVKQMYATGLQVAKDPGVWFVYIGCALMLIGLYIAFFMSHKRIWLFRSSDGGKNHILLAGSANKNRFEFSKKFAELEDQIGKSLSLTSEK